jgi:hypothetical protein
MHSSSGSQSAAAAQKRVDYSVRLASDDDREMVGRFNQRLSAGGIAYGLPGDYRLPGERLHRPPGFPVFRELAIITDGSEMRAGVLMQHGAFFISGESRPFCWLQLPLSEVLIDAQYSGAFLSLMGEIRSRRPFLASLGIGSLEERWARFMVRMGWKHQEVPFVFYPVRPGKVLTGIRQFRRSWKLRLPALAAARSGVGAAFGAGLAVHRAVTGLGHSYVSEVVPGFERWADLVFRDNVGKYGATPLRDAAALNILYPPEDTRYTRLRIRQGGRDIGWVLLVNARMTAHKYFGDLHVGTIVTGFGDPAAARTLVHAGLRHLAGLGVDLVVANWSHRSWVGACRGLGFLPGPSNFIFFVSPAGSPLLEPGCPLAGIHLSRGDCDSPSSLMPPARA